MCFSRRFDSVTTPSLVSLDRDDCLALLRQGRVGRLAVVIEGQPHVVPLNYAVDAGGVIVFRTAELTVATKASLSKVAFEVDDIDPEDHTGWSVTVHGYGLDITHALDPESERLRRLPVHPWAPGQRDQWFKITPSEITGRRITAAAHTW
jgi:nitroimidazol reductase NimA-like FMN-containing flavoprotein (pyridoxamine 5'-phosphate oxidase superfamily)